MAWNRYLFPGFLMTAMLPAGCKTVVPSRETRNDEATRSTAKSVADGMPVVVQAGAIEAAEGSEESSANDKSLDLGTSLQLAGIDNPSINLAREALREAIARQEMAEALWYPSLSAGANLRVHRGNLQQGTGGITNVDSQSLYFGSGASATGSGTVTIPGVRFFLPLADTILEPRAARERVSAYGADSVGVRNHTMLEVTTAYLELVAANSVMNSLRLSEAELAEIARLTQVQADAGQGRSGDANRAKANLELLRSRLKEAEGEQLVTSTRLAGLLSLDPSIRLRVPAGIPEPIRLFNDITDLDHLTEQALKARPEISARFGNLAEANTRLRQEELRPWLPTVLVGLSVGGFGGGSDRVTPSFGKFDSRTDFDVAAIWSIRNAGLGNRALQQQTMARVSQAHALLEGIRQQVRREVSEAHADLTAAKSQMETARSQMSTAEAGFAAEMARVNQAEWRPLEAIDSTRQLMESRLELVRSVTAHNIAQFRLLVAVGQPPGS